jgi:two-component system, NarL family, nitrate/nitrite response regulator NarL
MERALSFDRGTLRFFLFPYTVHRRHSQAVKSELDHSFMSDSETKTIRLLIVDDHALFRESVARLLQAEPGLEVVANCASAKEASRVISASRKIDVLLLDLDLGKEKGIELLYWLQKSQFDGRVLVVTANVSDREVCELVRTGISGIFMKHGSPASLIQGIRDIAEGKAFFDGNQLRGALTRLSADTDDQSSPKLTDRERHVLSCVFEGLVNKQIAERLGVSETVVKSSLQQLFAKMGVRTRSQLVRIALEQYRDQL